MIPHGLVIFAKNVERVSAYYQQTLNLSVTETENSHQVLNGPDIELVIHAIPAAQAASITIEQPPVSRGNTAIKPAFRVNDLEAVRAASVATGGTLTPLKEAWNIRGVMFLDGCDPEGNVVQFKQLQEP